MFSSQRIPSSQKEGDCCKICWTPTTREFPQADENYTDMPQCDTCQRTYHWQCLVDLHLCTANDRRSMECSQHWHCPACVHISQTEKQQRRALAEQDEMLHSTRHPSWEPTEMLLANPDFQRHVEQYEHAQFSNQQAGAPIDSHTEDRKRQGYYGCTQALNSTWRTTQNLKERQNAIFTSIQADSTSSKGRSSSNSCGPFQTQRNFSHNT